MNEQSPQGEAITLERLSVPEALERLDAALLTAHQTHAALQAASTAHTFAERELQIARATLEFAIVRTREAQ